MMTTERKTTLPAVLDVVALLADLPGLGLRAARLGPSSNYSTIALFLLSSAVTMAGRMRLCRAAARTF
jgi:hypothetical protein